MRASDVVPDGEVEQVQARRQPGRALVPDPPGRDEQERRHQHRQQGVQRRHAPERIRAHPRERVVGEVRQGRIRDEHLRAEQVGRRRRGLRRGRQVRPVAQERLVVPRHVREVERPVDVRLQVGRVVLGEEGQGCVHRQAGGGQDAPAGRGARVHCGEPAQPRPHDRAGGEGQRREPRHGQERRERGRAHREHEQSGRRRAGPPGERGTCAQKPCEERDRDRADRQREDGGPGEREPAGAADRDFVDEDLGPADVRPGHDRARPQEERDLEPLATDRLCWNLEHIAVPGSGAHEHLAHGHAVDERTQRRAHRSARPEGQGQGPVRADGQPQQGAVAQGTEIEDEAVVAAGRRVEIDARPLAPGPRTVGRVEAADRDRQLPAREEPHRGRRWRRGGTRPGVPRPMAAAGDAGSRSPRARRSVTRESESGQHVP